MKNSKSAVELGPRPSDVPPEPSSRARAGVLAALRAVGVPTAAAGVGAVTGLHPNTVREHLEVLVQAGLARRRRAAPQGRGRPAWLYSAAHGDLPEYAGLARALAEALARTSERPWDDAVAAGRGWGRSLVARTEAGSGERVRDEVLGLLADLRFAPRTEEDGTVRLTCCPLLEAARVHPTVVCGVHLGLVRGALEQLGAESAGARLQPFAEPGSCLLTLGPAR